MEERAKEVVSEGRRPKVEETAKEVVFYFSFCFVDYDEKLCWLIMSDTLFNAHLMRHEDTTNRRCVQPKSFLSRVVGATNDLQVCFYSLYAIILDSKCLG